jgi:hypothetical protein
MAYTTHLSQGGPDNVVVAPVSIKENLYLKRNGGSLSISAGLLTYLLMYPDNNGGYHVEVASKIPDDSYVTGKTAGESYTGLVHVEDWQGNILKSYHYKNGVFDRAFHPTLPSYTQGNVKAPSLYQMSCLITDYYDCTTSDGINFTCNFDNEVSDCQDDDGGVSGGSGDDGTVDIYQTVNNYLPGGSDGTWIGAANTGPLCQYYTFSSDGNGNYVCNLNGLANGWTNSNQGTVMMNFSNTAITMPSSGITQDDASARFNVAYNYGLNETATLLNNSTITAAQAQSKFIELVAGVLSTNDSGSWDPYENFASPVPTNNYEVCEP